MQFLKAFILLAAALCCSTVSHAQTKNIVINAQQVDPLKMPFPGQTLTLTAEVGNTRDFRLPVRLLAVRDGKFYEVMASSGLLNSRDRPQYQFDIPAPLAELNYQFVLISPDGTAVSSQRLVARRSCIPDMTPALGELPVEVDGSARFNRLLLDNARLEREIGNLEKAAQQLNALSELVSQ